MFSGMPGQDDDTHRHRPEPDQAVLLPRQTEHPRANEASIDPTATLRSTNARARRARAAPAPTTAAARDGPEGGRRTCPRAPQVWREDVAEDEEDRDPGGEATGISHDEDGRQPAPGDIEDTDEHAPTRPMTRPALVARVARALSREVDAERPSDQSRRVDPADEEGEQRRHNQPDGEEEQDLDEVLGGEAHWPPRENRSSGRHTPGPDVSRTDGGTGRPAGAQLTPTPRRPGEQRRRRGCPGRYARDDRTELGDGDRGVGGVRSTSQSATASARSGGPTWWTVISQPAGVAATTAASESSSNRAIALVEVRTFSSGAIWPSVRVRIGLIARAEPSRAAAAPIRPPDVGARACRRRDQRVAASRLRAAATTSATDPLGGRRGGAEDGIPMAIPMARESTTVTGTGAWVAASWADWTVPDMSAEMWIETIASAPSRAAAS